MTKRGDGASGPEACTDCGGDLLLEGRELAVGDLVICPACGIELGVKGIRPVKWTVVADGDEG